MPTPRTHTALDRLLQLGSAPALWLAEAQQAGQRLLPLGRALQATQALREPGLDRLLAPPLGRGVGHLLSEVVSHAAQTGAPSAAATADTAVDELDERSPHRAAPRRSGPAQAGARPAGPSPAGMADGLGAAAASALAALAATAVARQGDAGRSPPGELRAKAPTAAPRQVRLPPTPRAPRSPHGSIGAAQAQEQLRLRAMAAGLEAALRQTMVRATPPAPLSSLSPLSPNSLLGELGATLGEGLQSGLQALTRGLQPVPPLAGMTQAMSTGLQQMVTQLDRLQAQRSHAPYASAPPAGARHRSPARHPPAASQDPAAATLEPVAAAFGAVGQVVRGMQDGLNPRAPDLAAPGLTGLTGLRGLAARAAMQGATSVAAAVSPARSAVASLAGLAGQPDRVGQALVAMPGASNHPAPALLAAADDDQLATQLTRVLRREAQRDGIDLDDVDP